MRQLNGIKEISMDKAKGTIIYIGGMEMPDNNAAAHRVLNNAKILRNLGYHVVFCGVDRSLPEESKEASIIDGFDSFPTKYPKSIKEWLSYIFDFSHIKYVLEKYPNISFVFAYNMHATPLRNVLKYCKKNGIKMIADVTEWYDNPFSFKISKFIRWIDTKCVMEILLKKANGIIAISKYLSDYYQPFVQHIIQLPPLVDVTDLIWHQMVKIDTKIIFTYTGFPGRDKDRINNIVQAFVLLPKGIEFRFDIIGIDEKQFLLDYPELREDLLYLGNKIRFLGHLPHKETVNYMLSSDYCVFIRENTRKNMAGFPTKFVECVTCGIGIIANKVSDLEKYSQVNNFILLDNFNVLSVSFLGVFSVLALVLVTLGSLATIFLLFLFGFSSNLSC